MNCRVCHSPDLEYVGNYQAYSDYRCDIYDCAACGSRFAPHDDTVYEQLHASDSSYYAIHEEISKIVNDVFESGNAQALRHLLIGMSTKFSFVIETIEARANVSNVLEIGCSRGYLSSYFITAGYEVLGVDASKSAIDAATKRFGAHFVLAGNSRIGEKGPYDAIFHVGTIGCVASPERFTRDLLTQLRPGGVLVFNSPNVAACKQLNEIWVAGTSPPDLVTLFSEEYWNTHYNDIADVKVKCCAVDAVEGVRVLLSRLFGNRLLGNPTVPMLNAQKSVPSIGLKNNLFSRAIKRVIRIILEFAAALHITPSWPSEFGMFIVMTRK